MTNSEISKEILKRLEEIEKQLDNIYIANNTTLDILIRCIGQNNTLHFQKDVQNNILFVSNVVAYARDAFCN